MKKYLIYWHVKDNSATYPHNDNMLLYAKSAEDGFRQRGLRYCDFYREGSMLIRIKVFGRAFFKKLAGSRGKAPCRPSHKQAASEERARLIAYTE